MPFHLADWRTAGAHQMAPVLAAEMRRWRLDFAWDVAEAWRTIEPARVAGALPGFVATDSAGRVAGWTCFLEHEGALQVAALVSSDAGVTRALVDGILASPDARRAEVYAVSVRDAAPGLPDALASHGFETVQYRYLERALDSARPAFSPNHRATAGPSDRARAWVAADAPRFARLCARAYADPREIRAFAPRGTDAEWQDYVDGLVSGPGCGRLIVGASAAVPAGASASEIDAGVIATDLCLGTGHIAQVAVDPARQGEGIGAALVARAIAAFQSRGFRRVTLLVSAANRRAADVYTRAGFHARGAFLVAVNRQPRRLTSVALATGGASTRR
jgi:ribosomal-protein-alanine N-acetyltransferase